MFTVAATVHIIIAFILIILILIQDSKGGAMGGGMFSGGSSSSILGATSATNLLVKLTRTVAILFAISCVVLTILTAQSSKSVVDGVVITPPAGTQEALPVTTPAQEPTTAEPNPTPSNQ